MLTFPQNKTFTLISSFFLELTSQGLAPRQSEFRISHESTSTELTKAQAIIRRNGMFPHFSFGIIQQLEEYFLYDLDKENEFLAAVDLEAFNATDKVD